MYNRLFIPYPSPNVMSFKVKHIFRNFINKDRSVHRDSDRLLSYSLQPCMLHPHSGLNLDHPGLDAEGSPRNWLIVLAHALGYLHHVLEALQLNGVAQRVEVGLHSPVRLVTERLGDELLVPGGGCGLVEAHRAPREHAAHGVDVNRSLRNPVEEELLMDNVLSMLDEQLLDGAAERLYVGAQRARVVNQVRVHVGAKHVARADSDG